MKFRVHRIDADDLDVDVRHGDRLRTERFMSERGLGGPKDSPLAMLTANTFYAAKRQGADIPDTYDDFADTIDDISKIGDDDVAPFSPAPTTEN